jgi:hypothetical protein
MMYADVFKAKSVANRLSMQPAAMIAFSRSWCLGLQQRQHVQ